MDRFLRENSPAVMPSKVSEDEKADSSTPITKTYNTPCSVGYSSLFSPATHITRLPLSSPIYRVLHSDYRVSPLNSSPLIFRPVAPPPGFSAKPPEVSKLTWDDDSFAKTTRRLDYIEELSEDNERVIDDLKREVELYKHMSSDSAKELNKYKSIYRHLLAKKDSENSASDLFRILSLDDTVTEDCEMCKNFKAENEKLNVRVAKLSGENAQLYGNFNKLHSNFSKALRENQQLTRRLAGLSTDLDDLRVASSNLTTQQCELATLSLQTTTAEHKIATFAIEKDEIVKENCALKRKLDEIQASLSQIETQNSGLKAKIATLLEENALLNKDIQREVQVTKNLNDYINRRSLEFAKTLSDAEASHKFKVEELQSQIDALQKQSQDLKTSLRNSHAFIAANCPSQDMTALEKCAECLAKSKEIGHLNARVAELQTYVGATSAKSAMITEAQDLHAKCSQKLVVLSKAISSLYSALEGISVFTSFAVPCEQALKQLNGALQRVKGLPETINLSSEHLDVIRGLASAAEYLLNQRLPSTNDSRSLRSQVHKKIISIEILLNQLTAAYDASLFGQMKDSFLELPYLLKPLFDQLKQAERGPADAFKTANAALSSVLVSLDMMASCR